LHPITAQYTFFSAAHGTVCEIDHILKHKASLSKYKKTEMMTKLASSQGCRDGSTYANQ
jgi:hypothetical protein